MRDQPDRTVQQTPTAPTAHRDPVARIRGANAIDRYSLALQLIQVFPIILTGVALVFPFEWLRILIAVLGLVVWTFCAVRRERSAESARRHPGPRDADVPSQATIPLQTAVDLAPVPAGATATTTADSVHGIRVEIWLHSDSRLPLEPAGRGPRRRRDLHSPQARRAIRPTPRPHSHPHQQSHADEPEPDDRPGTPPASASRRARG